MAGTTHTVSSPNGETVIAISVASGRATYELLHRGHAVMEGGLGIEREDASFVDGLMVVGSSEPALVIHDDQLLHGKRLANYDTATEVSLALENASGLPIELVARAYDGAVAFRYRFPGATDDGARTITDEATSFGFINDGLAWMQPTQEASIHSPAYEALHADGIVIGTASDGPSWNLPALFRSGDRWMLLAESDLDGSYFGAHLDGRPNGLRYDVVLPNPNEAKGLGDVNPTSTLPWTLPWRVVMVADELGSIVESNLVEVLGRDCAVADPSWVRPGRVSWSWWSDVDSPQNLSTLRSYVDFASEMEWEHVLVDANWTVHSSADLRTLVDYAGSKAVGVFLWYNSGGPHNDVTEQPRDRMDDRKVRRAEMAKLAEWGIAGLKVDFFQSDKQRGIQLIEDIVTDAADYNLMVNLHGCTIPRGWTKRWPHLMTHEAVPGAEQYIFDPAYPELAPSNNTILAFTRNVIGPMDYTPVTFSDQKYPHLTTTTHELALGVIFESGLQHFADSAESYRRQDPAVIDILRSVPAVWDDTRFIGGTPGYFVILARVRDGIWYVAGINGSTDELDVEIPVDFIGDAEVEALVIVDGEDRDDVDVATTTLNGDSALQIEMASRGGFVARLSPPA